MPAAIAPTATGFAAARSLISAIRRSDQFVAADFAVATTSSPVARASVTSSSLKLEKVPGARSTSRSGLRRWRASWTSLRGG